MSQERPGPVAPLFRRPGRALGVALALTWAAVGWSLLVAGGPPGWMTSFDQWWMKVMLDSRTEVLTALALVFNAIGLAWVHVPLRAGVTGWLAWRRRWRDAVVFAATWAISWSASGLAKTAVGRGRPPAADALVHASSASYPSGHVITAASTSVALVLVLAPAGQRARWWVVSAAVTLGMMWSRTYLGVHWASDVIGGAIIGVAVALDCAVVADLITRRRQGDAPGPPGLEPMT
jgi:membrane-associated phospholipid phosphatase